MLYLADGRGWAPVIEGRVFASQHLPTQLQGVHPSSSVMNSFHFAATFNTFNTVAEP